MKKISILLTLALSLSAFNLMPFTSEGDLITQTSSFVSVLDKNTSSLVSNPNPQLLSTVFSKMDLYANIETIGVVVNGTSLPKTAELLYRKDGETDWHSGHPLMRIDNGRLAGSLFGLSPATTYNIKVLDGATEISGSVTTQPDELQFTPTIVLYVDDDASAGGDGSKSKPFKTIQEGVNHATAGTQVLVADGVYREAVSFPASGAAGNWIQVKAQGSGAILDGSQTLSGNIWTSYKKDVWFTRITPTIKYLARDGQRYYMYDNLTGLVDGRGHNRVLMNEGWYIAPNTPNFMCAASMILPNIHGRRLVLIMLLMSMDAIGSGSKGLKFGTMARQQMVVVYVRKMHLMW